MPLVVDGRAVGVITLYSSERLPDDRTRVLEMIAPHLASAVGSAQTVVMPIRSDADRVRSSRSGLRIVSRRV